MKILTHNIIIDGFRMAYGIKGEGEPIVLIHGPPSYSCLWRNVTSELVAAGYTVYLFDLLGYGASERPQYPVTDTL